MAFSSLRTVCFRNLTDTRITFPSKSIFFVGENGQGKTNLLEALYVCAYGASFRGVRDSHLIREGCREAAVSALISGTVDHQVSVKLLSARKLLQIDEKPIQTRKDLLSISPTIIFCHEDMEFVSGTPERRRWFFDQTLSLYDSIYLEDLQRYRHILKMRNAVLKEGRFETLDILDIQLVQLGTSLIEKRNKVSHQFSEVFSKLYESITGIDQVILRYKPSWSTGDQSAILEHLKHIREKELLLKMSLSGPHRDRYQFTRYDKEFEVQASTGQRRLLALLLRIAQAKLFTEISHRLPVLLLDDVLLELDPEKRKNFFKVLPEHEQAFFTFLPEEPYNRYRQDDTLVYHVTDGALCL
ncbi:DNA replication/repair protein RecF [Gracilinema caldarium]|uniref:DNA replication and repair protein RecF n=1 Tax=Gracilinema caldarium (strain ATCC 51460 / DSM 7334 / H1) TaxID=744872 RepID=F8EWL2_GRAC1|nr:DNA replication and repair protein RecF [Gracilinema caldarium]AEJ18175.1 DNA replication and repair protein recF [Gracilinema caldarium DSM 7334]